MGMYLHVYVRARASVYLCVRASCIGERVCVCWYVQVSGKCEAVASHCIQACVRVCRR